MCLIYVYLQFVNEGNEVQIIFKVPRRIIIRDTYTCTYIILQVSLLQWRP